VRVVTVIGNRPQFVKAAAVSRLLRAEHEEVLVHTGQHYDDELSAVFFSELGIPRPDRELRLGTGSNAQQLARMLAALAPLLEELSPELVLVYGDTNSTLAGGLAAVQDGIAVAHVEAGMRSFDRAMPEEINRVLTDHLSSLLLCSSQVAMENLAREGVAARVELVGDVMVDVALLVQPRAREDLEPLRAAGVSPGEYVLVTAHRAGNVDDPARLERLVALLEALPERAVLPLHPRTRARLEQTGLLARLAAAERVLLRPPVGYLEFTSLLVHARAMLTDSGGVQKEAYFFGVPCVTIRDETEWVELVECGANRLAPPLAVQTIVDATLAAMAQAHQPTTGLYGDGHSADAIARALAVLAA
jgi:UDP-N-acetylglucosamine 2-epimerase (non-hydrolysing)/UDP-GlcNAc3NAcA epimerase